MSIKNNLTELRGGKKQSDVAQATNISRQSLSKLESGQQFPKKGNAELLAAYFQQAVSFIVDPPEK